MNRYVVDAWAWIEYLIGSECGSELKEILNDGGSEVYTCAVTMAEVISKIAGEKQDAEAANALLLSNSRIVDVDESLSKLAGLLHAEMQQKVEGFGLSDAYVLATAMELKAKILTCDQHFKNVESAVLLK